jgi:hypothetical protein
VGIVYIYGKAITGKIEQKTKIESDYDAFLG